MYTRTNTGSRPRRMMAVAMMAAAVLIGGAGTGVAAPGATASPAGVQASRTLQGEIEIHIKDYENVGSNEHCYYSIPIHHVMTAQTPELSYTDKRYCGGEVRVELVHKYALDAHGIFTIRGEIRLFEGTSHNTTDLDGFEEYDFEVSMPNWVVLYKVWNSEDNAPDTDLVEVEFDVHNLP